MSDLFAPTSDAEMKGRETGERHASIHKEWDIKLVQQEARTQSINEMGLDNANFMVAFGYGFYYGKEAMIRTAMVRTRCHFIRIGISPGRVHPDKAIEIMKELVDISAWSEDNYRAFYREWECI